MKRASYLPGGPPRSGGGVEGGGEGVGKGAAGGEGGGGGVNMQPMEGGRGSAICSVTAHVTGSVTAHVTGGVTAHVTGSVTAHVTGGVTAHVTGSVTAERHRDPAHPAVDRNCTRQSMASGRVYDSEAVDGKESGVWFGGSRWQGVGCMVRRVGACPEAGGRGAGVKTGGRGRRGGKGEGGGGV